MHEGSKLLAAVALEKNKCLSHPSPYLGLYTASAQEDLLGAGKHRLSPLFYLAHGVITAVRQNTAER